MKRKAMALGASLALFGGLLSGCGGQSAPAAAPAQSAAEVGNATYQQIVDVTFGSPGDRRVEQARVTAEYQASIVTCMREAGFSYTAAPNQGLGGGPITPGDLTSIAPIGQGHFGTADFKRGVAEAVDKTSNRGYTDLTTDSERAGYKKELGDCISKLPTPSSFEPTGAVKVSIALENLFKRIEGSAEVRVQIEEYSLCMKAAGIPANSYLHLREIVQAKFPDTGLGWKALSESPAWATAVEFERRAAEIDADCRAELRHNVMAAGATELRQFTVVHAASLNQTRQEWAKQRALPRPQL